MRMVGTEVVSAALHAVDPEPDSGTHLDHHHHNGDHHMDHNGDHGENASSGSNEDINGDRSPLPPHSTHYDSGDGGSLLIHRCERCETYETLSRTALVSHMARCSLGSENGEHDGEGRRGDRKLFECDVCNMKFSNGANMRRHKMRHTGVKPYECRVCQKRFFRKDHLAEHFTTHTKTLPYHCPICNRGFQRQIAMRAHFQNEHVGQHDMIKSCPLCAYRAGTMKSLRVHFFNRHGIDLDNPGTAPGVTIKVEAAPSAIYSDSGDSQGGRSADNSTPPMHFLTPHVEISMTDANAYSPKRVESTPPESRNGDSSSPRSGDSNAPTSSIPGENGDRDQSSPTSSPPSPPPMPMPALSVIPLLKQENVDDLYDKKNRSNSPVNLSMNKNNNNNNISPPPAIQAPNSASLIKVSPLKSLLRDDLKRKLTSRVSMRGRQQGDPPLSLIRTHTPPLCAQGDEASPRKELPPAHVLALQNLQCVFCGIWFPDQTLYFLHKGCHCDSNPWKCNICGEQCANVYQFNSHLLSNTHQ